MNVNNVDPNHRRLIVRYRMGDYNGQIYGEIMAARQAQLAASNHAREKANRISKVGDVTMCYSYPFSPKQFLINFYFSEWRKCSSEEEARLQKATQTGSCSTAESASWDRRVQLRWWKCQRYRLSRWSNCVGRKWRQPWWSVCVQKEEGLQLPGASGRPVLQLALGLTGRRWLWEPQFQVQLHHTISSPYTNWFCAEKDRTWWKVRADHSAHMNL